MTNWQNMDSAPRTGRFLARYDDGEIHVCKIDQYGRVLRRSHQQRFPQRFVVENGRKILEEEGFEFDTHWSLWTRGYEAKPIEWATIPRADGEDYDSAKVRETGQRLLEKSRPLSDGETGDVK
jgi:hypothetical protein